MALASSLREGIMLSNKSFETVKYPKHAEESLLRG
jgi:hypothetical protein